MRGEKNKKKKKEKNPKKKSYYINWISIQWKIVVSSKNADKKSGFLAGREVRPAALA